MLVGENMGSIAPKDYVEVQRDVNAVHTDGSKVGVIELANEYMTAFVQTFQPHFPEASVIDIGCRWGYSLQRAIELLPASRIVGVDIVPEFIEEAQKITEAVCCDMHELPFADKEFDFSFCVQVLEHCYDPVKAAKEIFRVAKYGSFVSVPVESEDRFLMNKSHIVRAQNPGDWVPLFLGTHLNLVSAFYIHQHRNFNMLFLSNEAMVNV
jgi:ubiquinone/menaquinone biosynthesis C-methylase UbiE